MAAAARRLSAAGIEDAALEAEVLFRYVLAATESPDAGRPILDRASFFQRLQDRLRSEERRVGKECRSRWSPYH